VVAPAAGAVVLVRFPFSDLSRTKLRPAVALADAGRGDWIPGQVTSKPYRDVRAIELAATGFATSSLRVTNYARPATGGPCKGDAPHDEAFSAGL
jgi:mRNA interferase MazF